jgi:uncharacterized Zn finger protein
VIPVGTVTIKCPQTGREVSTGLVMERAEFDQALLEGNVVRCPACGRIHAWSKDEARLQDNFTEN